MAPPTTIAVANGQVGVGKIALALNLAACAALPGGAVIVDLDPQDDVAAALGSDDTPPMQVAASGRLGLQVLVAGGKTAGAAQLAGRASAALAAEPPR